MKNNTEDNTTTVKQLKEQGNQVEVRHERTFIHEDEVTFRRRKLKNPIRMTRKEFNTEGKKSFPNHALDNRGGFTTVTITKNDGTILRGEARCSDSEQFSRKLGLNLAIERALAKGETR